MPEYLLSHGPSDSLFKVDSEEERDKALANPECGDVTGQEWAENAYRAQQQALEEARAKVLANIAEAPDIPPAKEMLVVDVGDGSDEPLVYEKDEDAIAAIKKKVLAQASQMNVRFGTEAFHIMSTPRGRVVGFPFPMARPGQLDAVDRCIDILNSGKNCLLEAGTGTGKSPIAVAVATYFKSSYLLVGRNDLIDQWERDFTRYADMGFYKSRGRFLCVNAMKQAGKEPATCSDKKACAEGKKVKELNIKAWEAANEAYLKGEDHQPGPRPSSHQICPYTFGRDMALSKDHTAMTLALGLTAFKYMTQHPMVVPRELLVVDECSELESELIRFHTCTISLKTLRRVLGNETWEGLSMDTPPALTQGDGFLVPHVAAPNPQKPILGYLADFRPANLSQATLWTLVAKKALETVKAALEQQKFTATGQMAGASPEEIASLEGDNKEKIEKCEEIIKQVKAAHEAMTGSLPYCHKINHAEDRDWQLVLAPLEARGLFDRLMQGYGKRFLFVSATTGTASNFRASHGMKAPLEKVEVPSPFAPNRRPVIIHPVANMAARSYDQDLPKMLQEINRIAQKVDPDGWTNHQGQRGVIHTFTNKLTTSVADYLSYQGLGRRLFVLKGSGREREWAMEGFKACHNGILISPSAMLGLSLNDDLGRWQIIAKMPYAYLGDASVQHRKEVIDEWYEWQTAKDLIQTFGRVVRSAEDWGYTYVLDEGFMWFFKKNRHLFPSYVTDAFHGA